MISTLLNRLDGRVELDVDTRISAYAQQLVDQIGIKALQWSGATMKYWNLRAYLKCDMSKFKRNIPAFNKQYPGRELLEFQELLTCGQTVLSVDTEAGGHSSGCDDDVSSCERVIADRKCVPFQESHMSVK